MRTSAHGIIILMRKFSFEWDYGAGRMAFPIPALVSRHGFVFEALILQTDDLRAIAFGIQSWKKYHESLICWIRNSPHVIKGQRGEGSA
jgi:hypothetical protein